MNSAREGNQFK
jgi:hypothetical protein